MAVGDANRAPGGPLYSQERRSYFDDPAVDQVMQIVLGLAAEVWVLRDRVMALEEQLEATGSFDRAALDVVPADPAIKAARERERDTFVQAILGSLLDAPAT